MNNGSIHTIALDGHVLHEVEIRVAARSGNFVNTAREVKNAPINRRAGIPGRSHSRCIIRHPISSCTVDGVLHIDDSIQDTKILIHLPESRAEWITGAVVRQRTDVNGLKGHADLGG
jgi:hypothetical protein